MQESENPLIFDDGALEDADNLGYYFHTQAPSNFRGPQNLERYLDQLAEAYELVERFPEQQPFFVGNFRRRVFRQLPCMVLYEAESDATVVYAVCHVNQDHDRLLERLEQRREERQSRDDA